MSNTIQIKRGASTPEENNLAPYELGYVVCRIKNSNSSTNGTTEVNNGGYLYIGELKKNDSTKTEPIKIKAGYADTAGVANGLSTDVINSIIGIKVTNATNATNAEYANNFTEAAKEIIKGIKVTNATQADTATNATQAGTATNVASNDSTKSFVTTTIKNELGIDLNSGKLAINKELQISKTLNLIDNSNREVSIQNYSYGVSSAYATALKFITTKKTSSSTENFEATFDVGVFKAPKFCVTNNSYGTINPNVAGANGGPLSGVEGQLYFQVVSG